MFQEERVKIDSYAKSLKPSHPEGQGLTGRLTLLPFESVTSSPWISLWRGDITFAVARGRAWDPGLPDWYSFEMHLRWFRKDNRLTAS